MPYATASLFISRFGLQETTQLLADEQQLLTDALLLAAIAVAAGTGTWPGDSTPEQQAAAIGALARLTRQIDISGNFMDGFLRAAVTLPLADGDVNATTLEECCLALTRCGVADDPDNATERADKCCEGWRAWLKDVSAGRVQLVTPAGETPPSGGRVRTGQAKSGYNWDAFGVIR